MNDEQGLSEVDQLRARLSEAEAKNREYRDSLLGWLNIVEDLEKRRQDAVEALRPFKLAYDAAKKVYDRLHHSQLIAGSPEGMVGSFDYMSRQPDGTFEKAYILRYEVEFARAAEIVERETYYELDAADLEIK